ncbi:hypothetical protein [Paenibacillus koleovorans]|uniref:hypothetical protein n=1 Tax=Paenibacillus koleovorans TaxID=121608 RepID=UPI000FDC0EBA|nr:hypothetical protein [Paenibacillus koleovorans]
MTKDQIQILVAQLAGLNQHEWLRIKQQVDMIYSSKVAKIELDDLVVLQRNLEVEFKLRRFGDTSDGDVRLDRLVEKAKKYSAELDAREANLESPSRQD